MCTRAAQRLPKSWKTFMLSFPEEKRELHAFLKPCKSVASVHWSFADASADNKGLD